MSTTPIGLLHHNAKIDELTHATILKLHDGCQN